MSGNIFGWDIGGAHLKVAELATGGDIVRVRQVACPLWRGVGELKRAAALLDFDIGAADAMHAVTMTGELCDVFPDRASGVREILNVLEQQVAASAAVRVFAGYQGWLTPAAVDPGSALAVASANWLALAAFTAELIGHGILIDIGSTTTDLIPVVNSEVRCRGEDDAGRLANNELVYTGIVRTPVIGVCRAVPYRGQMQALAAEVFATMADVYRLLQRLAADDDLMPTADGGDKSELASAQRFARMLGRDFVAAEAAELRAAAAFVSRQQRRQIEQAIDLILSRGDEWTDRELIVGAGIGRFVVEQIAAERNLAYRDFADLLGADAALGRQIAMAAPAVAVAKLAWMTL